MSLPRWLRRLVTNVMNRQFKVKQQYDTLVRLISEEITQDKSG